MSEAISDFTRDVYSILCDKLSERTATLFLGAGINAGVKDSNGDDFPLGQTLSNWICKDLLEEENLNIPLTESSEMARYKLGASELNSYLFNKFSGYHPGTAHLSLVQLPWDVIYTTNYDNLVEEASIKDSITPAGKIRQVFSATHDLSNFSDDDILYYKLHGSIDFANSSDGRLILTKEDYRYYETNRKPLFNRLRQDLLSHTFLFVGYSLLDDNFRSILDDALESINSSTLPLSYCVQYSFSPVQETYWREKYNIQLIKGDSSNFLNELKINWIAQEKSVVPLDKRKAKEYLQFDESTQFPKVAESFYLIHPDYCTGISTPKKFFLGAEPSWNDIKQKVMSDRDAYWTLVESLFPELGLTNTLASTAYLITGAAGTGKTTLLYTIAMDIARAFAFPTLVHIPNTPLDAALLKSLLIDENDKRIIIVIRHAADYIKEIESFLSDARHLKLPVTVLLEERKNEWNVAFNNSRSKLSLVEFELGSLSEKEIESILEKLKLHGALGKLTDLPFANQLQHFKELAHKELLVALRELTSHGSFDDIIKDEYDNIPSDIAKKAYQYVATIGQIGIPVRFEVLIHLLDIPYSELQTKIFRPAEGILLTGEISGNSRFTQSFKLSSRHPIIASIIFDYSTPDDESKLEILNKLLANLDPGQLEDRKLLDAIVKKRELVKTLVSKENKRAIYETLQRIMPSSPFVLQHRSILERELENPDDSIKFAREALKFEPRNTALSNTLGLALENKSRGEQDPLKYQTLISEAQKYFDDGIKQNNSDPYAYLGKYYILKQKVEKETDPDKNVILKESLYSFLDEAYEATDESEIISNVLAQNQQRIGEQADAIEILERALQKDSTNRIIRDRLVTYLSDENPEVALKIAIDGTHKDVTAWKLQRHVARLMNRLSYNLNSVKGYYESAIRHNKGSLNLMVEYGAYLFSHGEYEDARLIFFNTAQLPLGTYKKKNINIYWNDKAGQKMEFKGKISSIRGAVVTVVAIPQNFEATFWKTSNSNRAKEGDILKYNIVFNGFGAQVLNYKK